MRTHPPVPVLALGIAFLAHGLAGRPASSQELTRTLTSPALEAIGSFGHAVAGVGDVNGNGTADVVVGARNETVGPTPQVGQAHVFDGSSGSVIRTLLSPNPISSGFFGSSVSGAGDVDADGTPDVLIGAPGETSSFVEEAGRAYVFSGANGSVLRSLVSPEPQTSGSFGRSVSGAGNVDGDAYDDLVIGTAEWIGGVSTGRAYVLSGFDGSVIHTLVSPSPETSAQFGIAVSGIGDANGDGRGDIVVGASWETDGGMNDAGRAYLFSGLDGSLLWTLVSSEPTAGGNFGGSVSGAGDVDGDGSADVVVGALDEDGGADRAGRAYVFRGADGGLLLTLQSPQPETFGLFGVSVSGAGDVDDDGHADLVVGSEEDSGALSGAGRVYVLSGLDGGALHTLVSSGPESAGFFGRSVAGTGALLGPGSDGVVIGAMNEDGGGSFNAGRAYVFGFEFAGPTAVPGPPVGVPRGLLLAQNRPNPFRRATTIEFRLPRPGTVALRVFDVAGREVSTLLERTLDAGSHEVVFDGAGLASGVYHYRLIVAGEESDSRRMLLVK